MKNFRNLISLLFPLQIIVLLLSPRFGWSIHNSDATLLTYEGTSYEDGAFHCLYQGRNDTIDISYANPLSKNFTITVNDTDEYSMIVKIDGASIESEPDMLPGIANDIVWEDTYGILFWRCILTVAITLISLKVFKHANNVSGVESKVFYTVASVIYVISMLISLRIIF
ncbi:MAG: hypothetical protein IJZ34_04925 [Lachnospiraceae bacterium]|nr:hypothetical protein [Lachnospiraceae bacterium]